MAGTSSLDGPLDGPLDGKGAVVTGAGHGRNAEHDEQPEEAQ